MFVILPVYNFFTMTKAILKQNISNEISRIEDENFLKAVYTIVSNKAEEAFFELDNKMKEELDARKENHKKGISKSYSWQSVKKAATSRTS